MVDFDLSNVRTVTFSFIRNANKGTREITSVEIDEDVQDLLKETVNQTWQGMADGDFSDYEPSQQYSSRIPLRLKMDSPLAAEFQRLHGAFPAPRLSAANASNLFAYSVQMTDQDGSRLTAIQRATSFKAIKERGLIRFVNDALQIYTGKLYRLDDHFDVLIDSEYVYSMRARGFEAIGKMKQAILDAVPNNIQSIKRAMPFVEWDSMAEYVTDHIRSARYLSSVCASGSANRIDKALLMTSCAAKGIAVEERNSKMVVGDGDYEDFLQVINRRIYEYNLIPGEIEVYRAVNRERLR